MKAGLGGVLYCLRILQIRFLSFFLAFAIQHPIVGCHDLEDNFAMRIVEKKIGSKQIAATDGHLLQSPAKIEDNVVQDKGWRVCAAGLTDEIRREKNLATVGLRKRQRSHGGIETCFGNSQLGGAGFGVFPRDACIGIILFRDVHQLRQRIDLQRIGNKCRDMLWRDIGLPVGRLLPRPVRFCWRLLTQGEQRHLQDDEKDDHSRIKTFHF